MLSFKQHSKSRGITFVDIDETLMYTTATVRVVKDGKTIRELSNTDFNTYQLKPGESYDFGQFKDAKHFRETSKPNKKMFAKVNAILTNIERTNSDSEIHMLTARGAFDNHPEFFDTFRDHGLKIDDIGFIPTGDMGMKAADAKKHVMTKYLKTGKYSRIRLYDDAISNLDAFLSISEDFPDIQFTAYHVGHDGKARVYKGK